MPVTEQPAPIYDSVCLTDAQWLYRRDDYTGSNWEWLFVASEQRVYLRRHVAGPANSNSEGWAFV